MVLDGVSMNVYLCGILYDNMNVNDSLVWDLMKYYIGDELWNGYGI